LALADNLTTQVNLAWDNVELASVAAEQGIDLPDWGLDPKDLGIEDPTETKEAQEDDFDEEKDKVETVCKKGDIWQLGNHRLMCGDSTNADCIGRLLSDEKASIVYTDPPYGVDVVGDGGNIGGDTKFAPVAQYKKVIGDDKDFDPSFILTLFEKTKIFLWGANYFANRLPNSGKWLVWDKNRGEGTTFSDCELCWTNLDGIAVKKYKCTWDGMRREGESGKRVHPTQKPLKLCGDILNDYSKPEDIIVDLFGGSGSTLIACEQIGRKCRMMELDPYYCDIIIARWEKLTGQKATKL